MDSGITEVGTLLFW